MRYPYNISTVVIILIWQSNNYGCLLEELFCRRRLNMQKDNHNIYMCIHVFELTNVSGSSENNQKVDKPKNSYSFRVDEASEMSRFDIGELMNQTKIKINSRPEDQKPPVLESHSELVLMPVDIKNDNCSILDALEDIGYSGCITLVAVVQRIYKTKVRLNFFK
jgi:hypothetical protein